ncbi:MAG: hypothetical protein D6690_08500 [Nitrospirae bacterium]|nr:MAG: hypothetical protein D6690_08500 [Nitrospirota bacterium]
MPNTLAHFGIQGIVSHVASPRLDPKLIFLGCLLPDLPWMIQRALQLFHWIDPYTLRLYCIAQASLAVTLCLCAALASLSTQPKTVFMVLGTNVLLHLLLDALQIKWANGVHLLAPLSWELWNAGIFWPESLPTYALTVLGLSYALWHWRAAITLPVPGPTRSRKRLITACGWLMLYVMLPVWWLSGPAETNSHFVRTLRAPKALRVGQYVEFDRNRYRKHQPQDILRTFAGEDIHVDNTILDHSAIISAQAHFVGPDTVHILAFHEHTAFRDLASYTGIALLASMWGIAWWRTKKPRINSSARNHASNEEAGHETQSGVSPIGGARQGSNSDLYG